MNRRTQSPIARSVDIGFGYTKVALSEIQADDSMKAMTFPSVAASTGGLANDIGGIGFGVHDTVAVEVDGFDYWVGPDVLLKLDADAARATNDVFFSSPEYLALYKGALAYMVANGASSTIDLMVGGLPLTIWRDPAKRSNIAERMTGNFKLPVPHSTGEAREVTVKKVSLVPQSLGALWSMAAARGDEMTERISSSTNLVVDAGYGTLMWLCTEGAKSIPGRSNANMGGVYSLLRSLVQRIDPRLAETTSFLVKVDRALRDSLAGKASLEAAADPRSPLTSLFTRALGKQPDMAGTIEALRAQIRNNMQALVKTVGDSRTIDNIFLTGGGISLYREALADAFPMHELITDENPQLSNLQGFQLLAEDNVHQDV